jgi:(R)-2-hydroxyacyl-CoA dehydratese activating ATPase
MIYAGVDAGSRSIKVALYDAERNGPLAVGVVDQGIEQERLARNLLERLLAEQGRQRSDVSRIVATGYGRHLMRFADAVVTEITCHAHGVSHLVADAKTIIEIGGQDSKLIRLNGAGQVRDFAMNDRCAAGTGRFLEVVATRLGIELSALGEWAGRSRNPAAISSMCVVFAETEIIGLLAGGASPADIVAGVQASIAARVVTLAGGRVEAPVYFTGGVALVPGMDKALSTALSQPVHPVQQPLMTGALGAAVLAAKQRA